MNFFNSLPTSKQGKAKMPKCFCTIYKVKGNIIKFGVGEFCVKKKKKKKKKNETSDTFEENVKS